MPAPEPSPPSTATTPSGTPELARLEVALSAMMRWSESKHTRAEVAHRAECHIAPSALRLLEHFDVAGAMRVSDIAECLRIDISTVSLQLRQLRADGLVHRLRDPADGRYGIIEITPQGREALARVRAARGELLSEIFDAVPADELGRAADVLMRVQDHMLREWTRTRALKPLN